MSLWKGKITVDDLNKRFENTLVQHLGIEFTEVGDDYIKTSMPVDKRTMQPLGMLHGGETFVQIGKEESIRKRLVDICWSFTTRIFGILCRKSLSKKK